MKLTKNNKILQLKKLKTLKNDKSEKRILE